MRDRRSCEEADLLGELDRVGGEVAPVERGERRLEPLGQLLGQQRGATSP
jgi:hypothetical protein